MYAIKSLQNLFVIICLLMLFCTVSYSYDSKQEASKSAPDSRWGHSMAYDSLRDRVVLFGGYGSAKEESKFSDTWEWDGEKWELKATSGPSARAYASMAFDKKRGITILHGGRRKRIDSNLTDTLADTWSWDGKKWKLLKEKGPFTADHHKLVYNDKRGTMLTFGGLDGEKITNDLWEWDGKEWHLLSSTGPPPNAAYGMVYDKDRDTVLIYGGLNIGKLYTEIWEWDGRKWDLVAEPYVNKSLDHHIMIYDEARNQIISFGGKNHQALDGNWTLVLRGKLMTEISCEGPEARILHNMVYDSKRKMAVLFGGMRRVKRQDGEEWFSLGDTWIWNGELWKQIEYTN